MPRSNDQSEAYSNMDSATREIIEVMTHVKLSGNKTTEQGEERYHMIKAFEDYRLEGKIEGILELLEEFEANM